jgi:hypothetical protein
MIPVLVLARLRNWIFEANLDESSNAAVVKYKTNKGQKRQRIVKKLFKIKGE